MAAMLMVTDRYQNIIEWVKKRVRTERISYS